MRRLSAGRPREEVRARADEPVPATHLGQAGLPSCPAWFDDLVLAATCAVLFFGGTGLLLADVGHFSEMPTLALGVAGTVFTTILARPRGAERARQSRGAGPITALGACALALGQFCWNAVDATRHVVADRDPGVYVLAGKWLAQHGSLVVPATTVWSSVGAPISLTSGGVYQMPDGSLQFQFAHLMSVLLAEAESLGGDRLMFRVPAALGALGLCGIFAVGCRLAERPWVVLAAVAGLALSLPELNVTRDTYSEASTQVLLWGGLLLVVRAYETRRPGTAFVAGLAIGGTLMTHIDAVVYLVPMPLLGGLAWFAARRRPERRSVGRVVAWGLAGAIPTAALGTFDVQARAGQYYVDLSAEMHPLYLLLGLTAGATALFVLALKIRPALAAVVSTAASRRRATLSVLATWAVGGGLLIAWSLRPAHAVAGTSAPVANAVGQLQAALGLPSQPARTYAEQTLRWFEWYLGPMAVALAIIGLCILVAAAIRSGPVVAIVLLALVGGITALYLWAPNNTPDQIWVTRRYATGALPLFALAAALAIDRGATEVARHVGHSRWPTRLAGVAAASLVAFPLGTVWPVRDFQAEATWLPAVKGVCNVIGPHAAVVFVKSDFDGATMPMALQDWCGVPAAVLSGPVPESDLAATAQAMGREDRVLWVLGSSRAAISRAVPGLSAGLIVRATSPTELQKTLEGPPEHYADAVLSVYGAEIR